MDTKGQTIGQILAGMTVGPGIEVDMDATADWVRGAVGTGIPDTATLIAVITPLIPAPIQGSAGLDGHTPTPAELTALITPLIPAPVKGDKGDTGLPGVNSFSAPATRTGLALATAYQASNPLKPAIITITLQAQSSITLGGITNNEGTINVGTNNTVATGGGVVVATYKNNLGGGVVVGVSLQSTQANTYTIALPAGGWWAVRQTSGTGLVIVSVVDQAVG